MVSQVSAGARDSREDADDCPDPDLVQASVARVVGAGLIIGCTGGILLGTGEAVLLLHGVLKYVQADSLPLRMWAGEAGRVILTHVLLWAGVLTLAAILWVGVQRLRSHKRPAHAPEPFLASIGVFTAMVAVPLTQVVGYGRYGHWMVFPLIGFAFLAAAATYVTLGWLTRSLGHRRLLRTLRITAALCLVVTAGLALAMIRTPAIGGGLYRLPPATSAAQPAEPDRPNVLWIVLDTVRADHLPLYGYSKPTTPFLDRFAEECVVYRRAFANGIWTVPSHASMFTGLSVTEHGATHSNMKLNDSLLTVAELLRSQGYATALFSNNPHLGAWLKFIRGFEHAPPIYQLQRLEAITPACWMQWLGWPPPVSWLDADTCTAYTNVFVTHWLDRLRPGNKPWFAFINYMDVHLPILVPKRYRRMFLDDDALRRSYRLRQRAYGGPLGIEFPFRYIVFNPDGVEAADPDVLRGQYDAALRYLDDRLRELIEALEQRGLLADTYVIITSDHGDAHGEHGLWSHMFGVYDMLARVPLIVRHPGGARTADIPTNVQLSDLFATVAGWAGVPPERLPPFCSPPLPERVEPSALGRVAVAEWLAPPRSMLERAARRAPKFDSRRLHRRLRAVIQGRYKFIWSSQGDNELYDLANDPLERTNLVASSRAIASQLEARLNEWLAAQGTRESTTDAEPDPVQIPDDVADQLRKLGYVQ